MHYEETFLYELNEKSGTWRRKSMLIDDVKLWPRLGPTSLVSFPLRLRSREDEPRRGPQMLRGCRAALQHAPPRAADRRRAVQRERAAERREDEDEQIGA